MYNIPILFITYNRVSYTKRVFHSIRKIKPKKLYLSSDGPKNLDDKNLVYKIRDFLIKSIDWDCDVIKLFQEKNKGCKLNVYESINYFFSCEEMGIILEDDTLPNLSFFTFCEKMLIHYEFTNNIYIISGENKGYSFSKDCEDIFFSRYPFIYGWATWRRVWNKYQLKIDDYSNTIEYKSYNLNEVYWESIFSNVKKNKINTWDYQLTYLLFMNKGLVIIPKFNLVTNIDFQNLGTHKISKINNKYNNRFFLYNYNIQIPEHIKIHNGFDIFIKKNYFKNSFLYSLFLKLKCLLQ